MVEPVSSSPVDKMANQARAATDHVAEKATDAITSARDSVRESVDSVAERADAATRWASDRVAAVKKGPDDLLNAGAEYIRARPYTAVGFALAFGYLVGRLRS
jgi:ElaB/YqjD/DUF883 family membrane-anchored ribosome-binding protein